MRKDRVWRRFEALPPSAQRQVADFIAFLSARARRQRSGSEVSSGALGEDPFVGIWKDRPEFVDSSEWVSRLREQEWASSRGPRE